MRIETEDDLRSALEKLAAQCALMAGLYHRHGLPPLRRRADGFEGLAEIVLFQQISIHAGRAIQARTLATLGAISAEAIAAADDEMLRACGLSRPKMRTLRAIAEASLDGRLDLDGLRGQEAAAITAHLTAVKGIGPWTADIYCLFCLGHVDAWPAGDLAVQAAVQDVLGLAARPNAREMATLGTRWAPWRGVAARLLWAHYSAGKGATMEPVAAP